MPNAGAKPSGGLNIFDYSKKKKKIKQSSEYARSFLPDTSLQMPCFVHVSQIKFTDELWQLGGHTSSRSRGFWVPAG